MWPVREGDCAAAVTAGVPSQCYWPQSASRYHVTMMACSPASASIISAVAARDGRAGYSSAPAMPPGHWPASIYSVAVFR